MTEADSDVVIDFSGFLDGLGDDLESLHQRSDGVGGLILNQGFVQFNHIHRVAFLVVDSGDVSVLDGLGDFVVDGFHDSVVLCCSLFLLQRYNKNLKPPNFFSLFFSGFQILVNRIRKELFSHFLVEVINTVSETVMPVLIWVHMILALLLSPGETGEDEYQDVETQIDRPQNDAGEREQEASSHAFSATTLKWAQQDVDQEKTDSDNEVDVHIQMLFKVLHHKVKMGLSFTTSYFTSLSIVIP